MSILYLCKDPIHGDCISKCWGLVCSIGHVFFFQLSQFRRPYNQGRRSWLRPLPCKKGLGDEGRKPAVERLQEPQNKVTCSLVTRTLTQTTLERASAFCVNFVLNLKSSMCTFGSNLPNPRGFGTVLWTKFISAMVLGEKWLHNVVSCLF